MRFTCYTFFIVLLFSRAVNAHDYTLIGDLLVSSYGAIKKKKPITKRKKRKKALALTPLSQQEKRLLLYPLFSHNKNSVTRQSIIDEPVLHDLSLFYCQGKNTHKHLLNTLNHTVTVFGEAALAHMLANPTTDVQLLRKRQGFIKELVNNDELFTQLDDMLEDIAKVESTFLQFWQKENEPTQLLLKKLYPKKYFHKNDLVLEGWVQTQNINTLCRLNKDFLLYGVIGALKPNWSFIDNDDAYRYKGIKKRWSGFKAGINTSVTRLRHALRKARKNKYGDYLVVVLKIIALKKGIEYARQKKKNMRYVQRKLMSAAHIVRGLKSVMQLGKQHTVLADGLMLYAETDNLFVAHNVYSQYFYRLIHNLQKRTFKGKPSFFSHSGRILATHTLMVKEKNNLVPGMQLIGEVDTCLSLAKLYKKFQAERVTYSFAEYVQSDTPYVALTSFWNPLVNPNLVVSNDLLLGAQQGQPKNIILTGSNTAGKSTFLKGIMINLLLAQTVGIVPAGSCRITPFEQLKTSLNITDDISSGNSLFKAEVLRAKSIVSASNGLQKSGFGFFVIDELFSGTDAQDGADAAYKIAHHLLNNDHTIFILATHYPAVTCLAQKTERCSNYKIEAKKNADGSITRTFKLEPGVSTVNIAHNILQQEIDALFD